MVLLDIESVVTGSSPIKLEICIGCALTGATTFADINSTYSAFEGNSAGTASGDPVLILQTINIPATNQSRASANTTLATQIPITLNAAGLQRLNGRISILATGIGGTSALQCAINFREER